MEDASLIVEVQKHIVNHDTKDAFYNSMKRERAMGLTAKVLDLDKGVAG